MAETERGEDFAIKLRRLFESVKREDGSEFSKPEVAEAVGVSRGYLYDLLKAKNRPSHDVVVALAEFFAVEIEYFSDTEKGRELNRQYELLARLGERNVRHLAARVSELSPDKLQSVMEFIDFQASKDDTASE